MGQGALDPVANTQRVTTSSDVTEDSTRRALASALTIGLLPFVTRDAVPPGLEVTATVPAADGQPAIGDARDPWNRWIVSVNGNASFDSEESTRESEWEVSIGTDRITPDWKLTFGLNIEGSREEFDLEDEQPLAVERLDRTFSGLAGRSLGEHWSVGVLSRLRTSTFENIDFDVRLGPAIEWNYFPYSMYTRRQLRVLYSAGGSYSQYGEETLFSRLSETRARQELSTTYEQREPWGTLQGRVAWSNFFPGLSTHRLSVEGEVNVRVVRGLLVTAEASASRIRDQLSLPRRGFTEEEILLRLRQLQSGFEARVELGITYQFGSRFASIVNPRFGQ
jgi:hypothetical protein